MAMMLRIILLFYIIKQLTVFGNPLHTESAFCRPSNYYSQKYHPLHVPEAHIPWVWEAVYDSTQGYVDVIVMSPTACSFNYSTWKEASTTFPVYHKHLADGLDSNILVNPDCERSRRLGSLSVIGKTFICVYQLNGVVIHRQESNKILVRFPVLGNLVVRCSAPTGLKFDAMQLESRLDSSPFCSSNEKLNSTITLTESFPVCTLPHYDTLHKQYNLSVVSATARAEKAQLVEWIEYHRLLGVEHFFIYNTAIVKDIQEKIIHMFSSYVKEGIVTLIPWYFLNCVKGMGSGRTLHFFHPNANFNVSNYLTWNVESSYDLHIFRPPKRIANYAALNSAYTRFRHTSTYILYVDEDEFLSFAVGGASHNIVEMSDKVFSNHPEYSSILFHPIDMNDCPETDRQMGRNRSYFLPRVGNVNYAFLPHSHSFEYKPLMRTDSVVFFSVHYVSLVEQSFVDERVQSLDFHYPVGKGAILHYKIPAHISQDPFSYLDFLPIRNSSQALNCQQSQLFGGYHNGMYIEAGHVLPAHLMNQLILNIQDKMKT